MWAKTVKVTAKLRKERSHRMCGMGEKGRPTWGVLGSNMVHTRKEIHLGVTYQLSSLLAMVETFFFTSSLELWLSKSSQIKPA